jgi:hypothetical protein
MKFRNNWKTWKKNLKQIRLSVRISSFDILTIEIDKPRDFYMVTILNFTLKNR